MLNRSPLLASIYILMAVACCATSAPAFAQDVFINLFDSPAVILCELPEEGQPPSPEEKKSTVDGSVSMEKSVSSRPVNPLRSSSDETNSLILGPTSDAPASQVPPTLTKVPRQESTVKQSPVVMESSDRKIGLKSPAEVKKNANNASPQKSSVDQDKQQEEPDIAVPVNVADSSDLVDEILASPPETKPDKLPKHQRSNLEPSQGKTSTLSASQIELRQRVQLCLAYYLSHPETIARRSPWGAMHAMLPFGLEANLVVGNKQVNSIAWMCQNGKCRTQQLFLLDTRSQRFSMAVGPGVQGHEGQFLAMLAQSYVPSSYPIRVQGKSYTVGDLIRYEMASCVEKSELTFKLIGLSHYLPSTATWVASDRKRWSISKLVSEELAQPIVGAACGGTHRLMGLTYAVRQRHEQGLPIDGEFQRASVFIDDFMQYAWTLQNSDGSFSTEWFEARANAPKNDRKVQTTGHILEWLVYTLPQQELQDPRVEKSLRFLLAHILDDRNQDWAIGPRSHALRAMAIYDQRVYGTELGTRRSQMAKILNSAGIRR